MNSGRGEPSTLRLVDWNHLIKLYEYDSWIKMTQLLYCWTGVNPVHSIYAASFTPMKSNMYKVLGL